MFELRQPLAQDLTEYSWCVRYHELRRCFRQVVLGIWSCVSGFMRQVYCLLHGLAGTREFGKRIPKMIYQHSSAVFPGHFLLSSFICTSVNFSGKGQSSTMQLLV